jgi:hypothetical protein
MVPRVVDDRDEHLFVKTRALDRSLEDFEVDFDLGKYFVLDFSFNVKVKMACNYPR